MRLFVFLFMLLPLCAEAVTVSRLYQFQPDTPAEADQVNAEFDNILSAINGNLDGSTNISQNAIATGNIASAAVTISKLGPLGQQVSSPPPEATSNSENIALIPNLTANITVDHRPVWVGLQQTTDGPGRISYAHGGGGSTKNTAYITFERDVATLNKTVIGARDITNPSSKIMVSLPCSAFWFMDTPTAGPHNYTAAFQIATGDTGYLTVENCKLVVFEL